MSRYNSLSDYLKGRFGRKMYKLAVDGGFTCPNRDGTKGTGGCIFCSSAGSGDFAEHGADIKAQLENAKKTHKKQASARLRVYCLFSIVHKHLCPGCPAA